MKNEEKSSANKFKNIDLHVLDVLAAGLKISGMKPHICAGNTEGVEIALETKNGSKVFVLIEPQKKEDGTLTASAGIYRPGYKR